MCIGGPGTEQKRTESHRQCKRSFLGHRFKNGGAARRRQEVNVTDKDRVSFVE